MPRLPVWLIVLFGPITLPVLFAAWLLRPDRPLMRNCVYCGEYRVCVSPYDPVCEDCFDEWFAASR